MNKAKYTTLIIVTYNQEEQLKVCVKTIRTFGVMEGVQVIVIDRSSEDGTVQWLSEQDDIAWATAEKEEGYSKIINSTIKMFGVEDSDIVLMEAGTALTFDAVSRLKNSLYKDEKIGIAGPVTNITSMRIIGESINSYEQACNMAGENKKHESKRVLSLPKDILCLRYDLLCRIGDLDERFQSQEGSLWDYFFRTIEAEYSIVCDPEAVCWCNNTNDMTIADEAALKRKWGAGYFNGCYNMQLLEMIKNTRDEELMVLEVGCNCGENLIEIKNRYPKAKVYGYEINEHAAKIASHIAEVQVGNLEEKKFPYQTGMFDYIIFGDVLEHLHNPEEVLIYCRDYLKNDGCIIASIPNLMHVSVIKDLLAGNFTYTDAGLLDKTHIHMFTGNEIMRMFTHAGYKIEEMGGTVKNSDNEEADSRFIDKLLEISPQTERFMFRTFQYMLRARR